MNSPKNILKYTYITAVLSVALLAFISMINIGKPAKSLTGTEDPQQTISAFFDALHRGDYVSANEYLGNCTLINTDFSNQSDVTKKLFGALCESISFKFIGDCDIDGLKAHQTIQATYFDIESSSAQLNELTKQQLDIALNETDDLSALYDENNEYRQDFIMSVFDQAAVIMLENAEQYYVNKEIKVDLFYDGNGWNIEPNDDIFDCMIGGMN